MMNNRFAYFDLGNVLALFDHAIAVRQLAELAGRSIEETRQVVFEAGLQNEYETGLITSEQFAATINQRLRCELPHEQLLEAISAIFQQNTAILPALELLKTAGVPMGVLSNTCEAHWLWLRRRAWPVIENWFDIHILSFEVHSMKPDAKIYEACEIATGCRGKDVFFTDDRADNIAAADLRGWTTKQFQSPPELIQSLHAWLRAG